MYLLTVEASSASSMARAPGKFRGETSTRAGDFGGGPGAVSAGTVVETGLYQLASGWRCQFEYVVMFIFRFVLGMWCDTCGRRTVLTVPGGVAPRLRPGWEMTNERNVMAGHARLASPIRSSLIFRRGGSRSPTGLGAWRGWRDCLRGC